MGAFWGICGIVAVLLKGNIDQEFGARSPFSGSAGQKFGDLVLYILIFAGGPLSLVFVGGAMLMDLYRKARMSPREWHDFAHRERPRAGCRFCTGDRKEAARIERLAPEYAEEDADGD